MLYQSYQGSHFHLVNIVILLIAFAGVSSSLSLSLYFFFFYLPHPHCHSSVSSLHVHGCRETAGAAKVAATGELKLYYNLLFFCAAPPAALAPGSFTVFLPFHIMLPSRIDCTSSQCRSGGCSRLGGQQRGGRNSIGEQPRDRCGRDMCRHYYRRRRHMIIEV
jgi:hypothetical protein